MSLCQCPMMPDGQIQVHNPSCENYPRKPVEAHAEAGKPWGGLWRCEVCEKSGSPDWYELVKGGSHYTNSGNCSGRLVHVERRICPAPADGALREAMAIWLEEPVVNHLWGDWETGYRTARAEVREIIDATFTHKSSQIAKKEAVNGD